MALVIKDGLSGATAHVTPGNRLAVDAVTEDQLELHSEKGQSAYWNSTYSATGGEEVIYIQNTEGTEKLHITKLVISSTVVSLFTLFKVTSATAAAGTALTYLNPNLGSGVVKQHNSRGNASVTGSLAGTTIVVGSIGVVKLDYVYDFGGSLILGNTDAIALTLTTTGVPQVHVEGYWNTDE